jgi:hypothetical protein
MAWKSTVNRFQRTCRYFYSLFFELAQHRKISKFRGFGQKLIVALKPGLLIGQFQMNVEILTCPPILVEIKYVWIIIADMEMIVDASGFGARPIDKAAQKFHQFCTFFWASVQRSGEGATWFHNFFRLAFQQAADVQAIRFFRQEQEPAFDVPFPGRTEFQPFHQALAQSRTLQGISGE